ncbi:hypothetical protein [Geobacillus sp. CAMR5420]|uniref:hypothetical protein n=1 Tax=Geobacillus TaxID=129337 RepID=UPI00049F37F9|nr:hypothetical protein [Geobacillus sp. CAMR5420]KDE47349.1 hypothetical protein DI44_12800 [Geobacillus sp. CAMR5420]
MNEKTEKIVRKEFAWTIDGEKYKVLNVPFYKMNAEEKEYVDFETALKLSLIRDLMVANEIPQIVDFEEVADIEI